MLRKFILFPFVILLLWACSPAAPLTPAPVDSSTAIAQPPDPTEPAQPTATPPQDSPAPQTPTRAGGQTPVSTEPVLPSPTPSPSPAPTAQPLLPLAGIETNNLKSVENIKIIAEAGAAWVRHDVFEWDKIEPARQDPPAYLWSAVDDQALQNARQAGLNVIGVVKYAPDWAQKDPGVACGPIAEAALERFGQFMYETVRRYSQPPYEIKYWELGNEIDVESDVVPPHNPFGCWGDRDDPFYGGGYYAEMLKVVYPQIKLADPEAQVLVGALLLDCDPNNPPKGKDCKSARFMEGILFNGGGPYFDGISFHGYDYYMRDHFGNGNWLSEDAPNGPVFVGKIKFLNNLLGQYKVPEKYLMLTEVAMLCGSIGTEPQCSTPLYAQVKRTFIIQTLVYSRANNLRAHIWYSLEGWRASGLKQGRSLEQSAYSAFQFFANFIADARWEGRQDLYPGVMLMEFSKQGKTYWVLWTEDYSSQITVNLPKSPTVIYNSLGEEQPLSTTLGLSFEPIIVGWDD